MGFPSCQAELRDPARFCPQCAAPLDAARVVKLSSDAGVKLEQAPQAIATVNGPAFRRYIHRREEQKIAFALVVPFKMVMFDILSQRAAQRSFSKENELG